MRAFYSIRFMEVCSWEAKEYLPKNNTVSSWNAVKVDWRLTDHQWCVEHDIKPGTFYNWVKRLRQKGCVDLPVSTRRSYRAPESQEVVRVDFHDTDPLPYEQPLNVIPVATERNNLSVAEPMKLSVGSFHLTIPNGTDPQLLAQTLRIVKELEC